jgi:hypothetical protein
MLGTLNEPVTSSTCSRRNHLLLVEGYEFWLIPVTRCAARVNMYGCACHAAEPPRFTRDKRLEEE